MSWIDVKLVAVIIIALAACRHSARDPLVVVTDLGPIRGVAGPDGRAFRGVPFAASPIGALRWQPPTEPAAWTDVRDATHNGHACTQLDHGEPRGDSGEDCLTLEVWVPPGDASGLPVMVWIPGGAFIEGGGNFGLYDGARLAAREHVIVVAINYRLGAFGFLAVPELAQHTSLGLLDQQAALRWVHRNIAAFGGDPAAVTIFGESAGAWSVCAQLALPSSRGLFARAIMESGACADALYFTEATAEIQGHALEAALGCADLECMRAKPPDAVLRALPGRRGYILPPGAWWGPVIDGHDLAATPLSLLRARGGVPLLVGWNRDEGTLHTIGFDNVTPEELASFTGDAFGSAAASVVDTYARATAKAVLNDVITDAVFACGARRIARTLSANHVPVYEYEFMHPLDDPHVHDLGATHSVELWFVFGHGDMGIELSAAERPLADWVQDAWGQFARTGAPGGDWPRYDATRDELELIDGRDLRPASSAAEWQRGWIDMQRSTAAHVKADVCDTWDRIAAPN